jgi:hypothetical protein
LSPRSPVSVCCICTVPFFVRGSGWSWSWIGVWSEEDGHEGSAVRGASRSGRECDRQRGEQVCEEAPQRPLGHIHPASLLFSSTSSRMPMTTRRMESYPASSALSTAPISTSPLAVAGFVSCEIKVGPVVARTAEMGVTLGRIVTCPSPRARFLRRYTILSFSSSSPLPA